LPSTILLLKTTNKLIRFLFLNYNKIKNKKQINQKIRNYKNLEMFKKRKQKKEILPHVQRIQAREMSPLLGLQQMRSKYGSPLSLD